MAFPFTKDDRDKDYEDAINVLFEENYAKVYKKIASILYDTELANHFKKSNFPLGQKVTTLRADRGL